MSYTLSSVSLHSSSPHYLSLNKGTGALTELLSARAPPLIIVGDDDDNDNDEDESKPTNQDKISAEEKAIQLWVDRVNTVLHSKITSRFKHPENGNDVSSSSSSPGRIQVFARIIVPKKFNA